MKNILLAVSVAALSLTLSSCATGPAFGDGSVLYTGVLNRNIQKDPSIRECGFTVAYIVNETDATYTIRIGPPRPTRFGQPQRDSEYTREVRPYQNTSINRGFLGTYASNAYVNPGKLITVTVADSAGKIVGSNTIDRMPVDCETDGVNPIKNPYMAVGVIIGKSFYSEQVPVTTQSRRLR